ncbi:MAG TPA: hypothetical protein PKD10_05070 [Paracoccaceae bacterium]|nr:hypothetical protein [Paracoccaceae bacterium]HMO72062.1 hypothetical protein [Paracoccaceae bacterium]
MDIGFLVPLLALGTLLAVCVFALVSRNRVDARRANPSAPKSSLATDGPGPAPLVQTMPPSPMIPTRPVA